MRLNMHLIDFHFYFLLENNVDICDKISKRFHPSSKTMV